MSKGQYTLLQDFWWADWHNCQNVKCAYLENLMNKYMFGWIEWGSEMLKSHGKILPFCKKFGTQTWWRVDKVEPSSPSAFGDRCVSIILVLEMGHMTVASWFCESVLCIGLYKIPAILLTFLLPFWKFFLDWQIKSSPVSQNSPDLMGVPCNAFSTHRTVLVWCLQGISLSHLTPSHATNQGLLELRFTSPPLSPCWLRL